MTFRRPIQLLVFAVLLLGAAGCNRTAQGAGDSRSRALPVKTQTAQLQRVPDFTEYIATLRSRAASVLQPDVDGQITRIFVRSGQQVEAGTPLLQIDPAKQQATVTSQEANQRARLAALDYNRTELERRQKLYAAGVISKQNLDQAQSAYEASKAEVDALQASVREQQVQLRYHTVNAPASGIIGDIPVRVGDRVKPDTVLTTLDTRGDLEAYVSIPAELASKVRLGAPVEIMGDDGRPVQRVAVTFVSPRVDPESQLLLVKAVVANPQQRFRNEQLVHVHLIWRELERPLIPVTAVSRLSGQMFAFVLDGSGQQAVARQKAIRTGEIVGNNYVVLDGIKAGDKIITSGVQMLVDGMPVSPES